MAILIDGYNLLNATGVEGTGHGTELERARRGLLRFLTHVLTVAERNATTIVFDAQGAPPGLPDQDSFHGITILFSRGYAEADDLLEELIASDHSPRQLLVVSSDHRLHRAARRRRATAIDSEVWIEQLESRSPFTTSTTATPPDLEREIDSEFWLKEFSDIDVAGMEEELRNDDSTATPPGKDAKSTSSPTTNESESATGNPLANPFPEGFGSELDEELKDHDGIANPFPADFFEDEP